MYRRGDRWEIVDWKTGKAPKTALDLEQKTYQLALYRLAFAEWKGIDPATVDAVFFFVADDRIIRPEVFPERDDLLALWRESRAALN